MSEFPFWVMRERTDGDAKFSLFSVGDGGRIS